VHFLAHPETHLRTPESRLLIKRFFLLSEKNTKRRVHLKQTGGTTIMKAVIVTEFGGPGVM
jgi:hypothetical protein